jgi:adenylate cyclase
MNEIERKYLVNNGIETALVNIKPKQIRQGYILNSVEKTVRVRTKGEKGYLTIKGQTTGITRSEFEYEIPYTEAIDLLTNFCPTSLIKDRYEIAFASKIWEVDVFHGKLEGLIIAEIELESEDEQVELPNWVEEEVSSDVQYYNSNLINRS